MVQNSTNNKVFVGVDVSKESLDFFVYPVGMHKKIQNEPSEIAAFCKEIKSCFSVASLMCESTGGYEDTLLQVASGYFEVIRAHPSDINSFGKALGIRAKTDRIDAEIIAHFASFYNQRYTQKVEIKQHKYLSRLMTRREQLVEMLLAEKCRIKRENDPDIVAMIESIATHLQEQIDLIQEKANEYVKNSQELSKKVEYLTSFKGVGQITAVKLIAHLPELGVLNRYQIAALSGLAPFCRESGSSGKRRVIKGGRKSARNAIYMSAIVATRHNKIIRPFYKKLQEQGKPFQVCIVAAMRKMLVILNTMLKNEEKWKFA